MTAALLFDLDDTLISDVGAAAASFRATAALAASRHGVDALALADAAERSARELWHATPVQSYCHRIQISSWEGLWCRFEGDDANMAWLREWAPTYRRETWRRALEQHGVDDPPLGRELGERFAVERRARHEVFDDAAAALTALARSHRMALVTNGASCLQREKLAASGLAGHFGAVVVSGDLGVGKPDAAIFGRALAALGCEPADAVMIGDNPARDVGGALAAGLRAVWVNRLGAGRPSGLPADVPEVATLRNLPRML